MCWRMADADDQELSDLLQQVGEKSGWFDESGDRTMVVMQDVSVYMSEKQVDPLN